MTQKWEIKKQQNDQFPTSLENVYFENTLKLNI